MLWGVQPGAATADSAPTLIGGRYALCARIATGGMAGVYFGRQFGAGGFSRVVAIKRLHPHLSSDPAFVSALFDEAKMASRVRHPNVAQVIDVLAEGEEVFLVMEYVHGEKLSTLLRACANLRQRVPLPIAVALVSDVLRGLHAAHEATLPDGSPLGLVHRDVSPQNILVSADGSALVIDFGVAKAVGRSQTTRDGQLKGKIAYMSVEQLSGGSVTRTTDVYSAAVVLWEVLAGQRLFSGDSDAVVYSKVTRAAIPPLEERISGLSDDLLAIVRRGLAKDAEMRFPTALAMAEALEQTKRPARRAEVQAWLESVAGDVLAQRAEALHAVETAEVTQLDRSTGPQSALALPPTAAELTQFSTQGVSRSLRRPPRKRSRTLAFVLVGTLLVAAGVLGLRVRSRDNAAQAASTSILPQPSPKPRASTPTETAASKPSAETAETAASATPSASTSSAPKTPALKTAAPPRKTTHRASTRRTRRAPSRKKKAAPTKTTTDKTKQFCQVLGSDGIWRIRPCH